MAELIFLIIIIIISVDFIFERILDFLNYRHKSPNLPEELKDVYDKDEFLRQHDYEKTTYRFSLITSSFSYILILAMLLFKGFALIDAIGRDLSSNPIVIALVFFGILMLASDILTTPFSLYGTFVIEEKFGFNKTTLKTFFLDKIKSYVLGAIIGGALLAVIIGLFTSLGSGFWIYAWIVITFFMVFITMFYSNTIVPLFNKQEPLEEGELRDKLNEFSIKSGFNLKNIFVIDGSKRSTKANAYFSGLGAKKRIVLYDTLIEDLGTDEIVAVLSHEIGHYKKKHTLSGMIISILQTGLTLYLLSLFVSNPVLSEALGVTEPGFHIGLIAFGILYSPISTFLSLGMNILSRKNEYQADKYAADFELGDYLISGLKKLSANNLSNLTPHPLYVFFHYSHPPLLQRIRALKKL